MEDVLGEALTLPFEILTFLFGLIMMLNLNNINYELLNSVADIAGQREIVYEDLSNDSVEGHQESIYTETGAQVITDMYELYGQDNAIWKSSVDGVDISGDVLAMVQNSDYSSITGKLDITSYPMNEYEVNVARAEVK